ncbi:MAG TPA: hypothetical protein PKX94_04955 [Opitutales bacterium]|nr:hypothetical protein [Opitutales bacterium]
MEPFEKGRVRIRTVPFLFSMDAAEMLRGKNPVVFRCSDGFNSFESR